MEHKIYRVVSFERIRPFTLKVVFDDGSKQTIDFQPILIGEIYGPLQDEKFFSQVEIDPEVHTLIWPNGADFDPATLHDWHENIDEMKKMAERWRKINA
jgi:hypothetical protein